MAKANPNIEMFLDSGAYSALTKGALIDIDEYIAFIKENEDYIDHYSVLDVISDPVGTLENQKIMEAAGLSPIPCYHYGEPTKYLDHYAANYPFISLGGLVGGTTKILKRWLDDCWLRLVDENDMPICKVHAFGMTSLYLMRRYPWYSVDSTTWVLSSRHGNIFVPHRRKGEWIYTKDALRVAFSTKSPKALEEGNHINTFPPLTQQVIKDYIEEKGYIIGKSEFRMVDADYKPDKEKGERWFNRKTHEIEIVIEKGLSNNYQMRDEINIIYFLDLQKTFPEYPHPWKDRKTVKRGLF
jgi:hypothetical protein